MLYSGIFRNIYEHQYKVEFVTGNRRDTKTLLTLTDQPCVISQVSDGGIFSPIKSRTCTIEIVTNPESEYTDLYTIENHGIPVTIYEAYDDRESIDTLGNSRTVFYGFLTPCAYNQPWTGVDVLTLEAVDAISTLKNVKYTVFEPDGVADFVRLDQLISRLLTLAGLDGDFHYATTSRISNDPNKPILSGTYISEANFFDDDDERTPWSCYEVLEEICKYFGWTLVRYLNETYLLDYRTTDRMWHYNAINGTTVYTTPSSLEPLTQEDYFGSDSNYSYDTVHSKITISQNCYDIDEVITDPYDNANLISITAEQHFGADSIHWVKRKKIKGYQFSTYARLRPESGWTHHYYSLPMGSHIGDGGLNYTDGSNINSPDIVNRTLNTQAAIIQKYAGYAGNNPAPASLGWDSVIAFYIMNENCWSYTLNRPNWYTREMLTYNSKEKLVYSPSDPNDTVWVKIKGDLWFQDNSQKSKIYNDETGLFVDTPLDQSLGDFKAITYEDENAYMTCHLRIGDKWYNGNHWVSYKTTFSIPYGSYNEKTQSYDWKGFEWMSPISNVTYEKKVNDDCYAIPIKSTDNLRGTMEFALYNPKPHTVSGKKSNWYDCTPVVFLKNFSLDIKFTDQDEWYLDVDEDNNNEIVFSSDSNDQVVAENLETKLRINSYVNEDDLQSRISKSHVLTEGGYLNNVNYDGKDQYQELHLVDKYLSHMAATKRVYDTTLNNVHKPFNHYTFTTPGISGAEYIIDSYEWDLLTRSTTIKFIEY